MDPKARPLSPGARPSPAPPPTPTFEAAVVMIMQLPQDDLNKLARWFKR